jgi:hypothetical protein
MTCSLYSPRGQARLGPPAGAVDGDLLAGHGSLQDPRSRSRDGRGLLLRRGRQDQRVHGRVPDPEPRPGARGRCGAVVRLRPGLQRAAREGRACPRLARCLQPVLAHAARPQRCHGAVCAGRAAPDRALPAGRRGPRRWARAGALPDRDAARHLGDRRRDPQQLRALHGAGADTGVLEPRDHRRPRRRRAAGRQRERQAVRLCGRDRRRDADPGAAAGPLAQRPHRRTACSSWSTGAIPRSRASSS